MAIVDGNGIGYIKDINTWSTYEVWVDGRPILEISVDNLDPELKIWVGRPGACEAKLSGNMLKQTVIGLLIETDGRAVKGLHEVGGTDVTPGDIKDHIDGITIYQYVLPRLLNFIADVYIPKSI